MDIIVVILLIVISILLLAWANKRGRDKFISLLANVITITGVIATVWFILVPRLQENPQALADLKTTLSASEIASEKPPSVFTSTPTLELSPSPTPTSTYTPTPPITSTPPPAFTSFDLDLSQFSEGDPAISLGTDIIVREDSGGYISGRSQEGTINIQDLSLVGKFIISFRVDLRTHLESFYINSTNGNSVYFEFFDAGGRLYYYHRLTFGDINERFGVNGDFINWKVNQINDIRLDIDTIEGSAKLFVNSDSFNTVLFEPNTVFDGILISNISPEDRVFNISVQQLDE